jgi:oligopeptidase A
LPSTETGRRYREAILEVGGSRPAMESFKAFRGREPNLDALLRHQGMAGRSAARIGSPRRSGGNNRWHIG